MRELTTKLQSWRAEGLVSQEQADAIASYEAEHGDQRGTRRTVFAEAVGYVGAALSIGAVAMIVGDVWHELGTGGRLVLVALLTLLLAGAGAALAKADRPPLQRLATLLLTGAVAGVAWLAFLVAVDIVDADPPAVGLAVGLAALTVALPLYGLRRRAVHQLTVLAALLVTVMSALTVPAITLEPMWFALAGIAVGGGWFLLATGGWLEPRPLAQISGAAVALLSCQAPGPDAWPWMLTALGVAIAAGLVALAVIHDEMHHLVVGALALFVLVPRLVFSVFGEAIGAPAALLVVGLLLVLLAVGIGRASREVRRTSSPLVPEGRRGPGEADREEASR